MAIITPALHGSPTMFDPLSDCQQLSLLRIMMKAASKVERVVGFKLVEERSGTQMADDLSDLARDLFYTLANRLENVDPTVQILGSMPHREEWRDGLSYL